MEYLQLVNNFLSMYEGVCVAIGIILAVLVCDSLIRLKMHLSHKRHLFFLLLENVRYPVLISVAVAGLLLSLKSMSARGESSTLAPAAEVVLIGCVVWILIRMVKVAENYYLQKEGSCAFTANISSMVAKGALVLLAGLMILDKLGVNIGGILAVGGIGGIALGLASKDLFANFFGFVTIVLDRPFKVGDLIYSSDRDIRGVVDRITWRFTRVITLEKKPMYIPNSIFSTIVIQNESKVLARRIDENLKFEFHEHTKIDEFTKKISSLLKSSELLNQKFRANFDVSKIGTDIIEVRFVAYTKAKAWVEFSVDRQKILLAIFEVAKELGFRIMYPETQIALYDNR